MKVDDFNQRSKGHFPEFLGINFIEINEASMKAELEIRPEFLAPNNYLHAGCLVTLADTVAGYSTILNLPDNAKSFTTIELKSNFLGTLKEGVLEATSEPEHMGRTTQIWRVIIKNQANSKKLAIFSCTQMILY